MPAISGKLEKMEGSPFFAQLHHREGQTLATVMDVKKDTQDTNVDISLLRKCKGESVSF